MVVANMMLEEVLAKVSAFVEKSRDRYQREVEYLASDAYEVELGALASLVFDRIIGFDTTKHQPPSVEPYRVLWECRHEIEDFQEPGRFVVEYEAAQRRMAELSSQLTASKGVKK
jgi:hypothetical protein